MFKKGRFRAILAFHTRRRNVLPSVNRKIKLYDLTHKRFTKQANIITYGV